MGTKISVNFNFKVSPPRKTNDRPNVGVGAISTWPEFETFWPGSREQTGFERPEVA